MSEAQEIILEIISDLEGMTPEEIRSLFDELLKYLDLDNYSRAKDIVERVRDYAIERSNAIKLGE